MPHPHAIGGTYLAAPSDGPAASISFALPPSDLFDLYGIVPTGLHGLATNTRVAVAHRLQRDFLAINLASASR